MALQKDFASHLILISFIFVSLTNSETSNSVSSTPKDIITMTKECTCGTHYELRGRIIGGVPAEEAEFPWQVGIFRGNRIICGGSLINDRYVLTASHCFKIGNPVSNSVQDISRDNITVLLGGHKIDLLSMMRERKPPPIEKAPSYILLHPLFDPFKYTYDIALIKLNTPVEAYTNKILPICLPPLHFSFENLEGTISGWGATKEGGGAVKMLRKTNVRVLSNDDCKEKLSQYFHKEVMMCASSPGHDACQGDSGGPLVSSHTKQSYMQIGITSYGIGCGDYKYPGVYTRLNRFIHWVKKHTQDAYYCNH